MPSTPVALGSAIHLSLTLATGTSGRFPQCHVYDSADVEVAGSPFDLAEIAATGRYTSSAFTPLLADTYIGLFITYRDAGHTIRDNQNGQVQEAYPVTTLLADVAAILVDTTAILANTVLLLADTAALLVLASDISEIQRAEVVIIPAGSPLGGAPREERKNGGGAVIATGLAFEDESGLVPYRNQGMNDRKRLS